MDKNKLNNYILTASIHTVEVHGGNIADFLGMDCRLVKPHQNINKSTGEIVCHCIINPHYYVVDEILKYSEYEEVMASILEQANVTDYEYDRVDIRLDSYEENYQDYFKLNSLLLGLFTMRYMFKNDEPTESAGQITRHKCGVYVKNQQISIDYYDKKKESENKYPCKARLEFRAMKLKGKTPKEVADLWFKRLNNALGYYKELQEKYNCGLYQYYLKWLKDNFPKSKGKDKLRYFVRENKDCFFTPQQLEAFCELCGVEKPTSRAKSLKRTCGIEFITYSDIKIYVQKIKNAITYFLEH